MLTHTQNNLVPLSHSLGNGTVGQSTQKRDNPRDKNGTNPLKGLAYLILQRDKQRDNDGTKQKNKWDKAPQKGTSCPTTQGHDFCPLQYLNERDIGISEVCPERGLHLVAGYSLSQDLKHLITWWALGSFDKLLAAIHEKRPIARRVIVSSLNRYRLPRA